jgi:hypothetical protein
MDIYQSRYTLVTIERQAPGAFERFLKQRGGAIQEEPPTSPEKDEMLWCGPTGNTVRDFGGKTFFAMTGERARGIRTPDQPADLLALLGMDLPAAAPRLEAATAKFLR